MPVSFRKIPFRDTKTELALPNLVGDRERSHFHPRTKKKKIECVSFLSDGFIELLHGTKTYRLIVNEFPKY